MKSVAYLHGLQSVDSFHLGDQLDHLSIPLSPVRLSDGVAGSMFAHEKVGLILCDLIRLFGAVLARCSVEELQDERSLVPQAAGDKDVELLQAQDLNLGVKQVKVVQPQPDNGYQR